MSDGCWVLVRKAMRLDCNVRLEASGEVRPAYVFVAELQATDLDQTSVLQVFRAV